MDSGLWQQKGKLPEQQKGRYGKWLASRGSYEKGIKGLALLLSHTKINYKTINLHEIQTSSN